MSLTPEKILGWALLIGGGLLAWAYRDGILAFIKGGKLTGGGQQTPSKTDPCEGQSGLPLLLCETGRFITGNFLDKTVAVVDARGTADDPGTVITQTDTIPLPWDISTTINLTPNSPLANTAPQSSLVTSQALVAKLNAGGTFTAEEWKWMKQFEPTLYGIAGGWSGKDPNR